MQCKGITFCTWARWDTTVLDSEQLVQIQNGFSRLKRESISGVMNAIDSNLSEGLEHTTKSEYLEREVIRCCVLGSRVMFTQLPFMAIHLALCGQNFAAPSVLRNGHYDYLCDCICTRTHWLLLLILVWCSCCTRVSSMKRSVFALRR